MTILKKLLRKAGLARTQNPAALEAALQRAAQRGTQVQTVIDIGASNGSWSKTARKFFPTAYCHLIEANSYHQPALATLKRSWEKIDFTVAAAGDSNGEIFFDGSDPFGGLASHDASRDSTAKVPVVTIDHIRSAHTLAPPFLLKLDTHGFEVPIFEGAKETLQETSLVVVETYNFKIAPASLRFHEICQYLEERGFRCVDICDPLFRPKDQALWQFDLFFEPASNSKFLDNTWS
ncbi:FkbM family methyltransferase [Pseudanabaena sp. FACHB-2040]|uniref:FkbM family methyltransferase n=1 Tax=Pseudanabaena sp. FACHB-2040 TaxID=2692859 RepID=UPI001689F0AF|nr:FkbM family methyltransferase [Pseudanabaena sp. FACHB-2040]MBD2260791.1 FkbM family methyltransferase [Pseudanabaena sp. FACHB-2040]